MYVVKIYEKLSNNMPLEALCQKKIKIICLLRRVKLVKRVSISYYKHGSQFHWQPIFCVVLEILEWSILLKQKYKVGPNLLLGKNKIQKCYVI